MVWDEVWDCDADGIRIAGLRIYGKGWFCS